MKKLVFLFIAFIAISSNAAYINQQVYDRIIREVEILSDDEFQILVDGAWYRFEPETYGGIKKTDAAFALVLSAITNRNKVAFYAIRKPGGSKNLITKIIIQVDKF